MLSELRSELKDIQTFNTSYFIYLAFIFYYLEKVTFYVLNIDFDTLSNINLSLYVFYSFTVILLICSFVNFVRLVTPNDTAFDLLPKQVYDDYFLETESWIKRTEKELDPINETNESYLITLERANTINFLLLKHKRNLKFLVIVLAIVSIIPYTITIIIFGVANV